MTVTTVERATRLGIVRGIARLGVETYRGLRYAEPVQRFRQAVLFDSAWDGTYDATTPKPMALQVVSPAATAAIFGPMPDAPFAEDCLFLNIHAPAAPSPSPRAVIVFIHGGSFAVGAANFYDGTALARGADAVVVCINYRLGIFAAFDLAWLGTARDGGGQHWLGDQITALKWVRDNIADYGGDPARVTIVGESAGAVSAAALCAAPAAEGLVHRAVACSPGALIADPSTDVVGTIAKLRRCSRPEAIAWLQSAPAADLVALQRRSRDLAPIPVCNTPLLPGPVEDLIRARGSAAVPLIAGFATHEGMMLAHAVRVSSGMPLPLIALMAHLAVRTIARHAAKGQAKTKAYLKRLRRATGSSGFGLRYFDLAWTDGFRRGATDYVEETSRAGSKGWLYIMDVPMRFAGKRIASSHGIDLALTFNVWDDPEHTVPIFPDHPEAPALARRWVKMLGDFARHGEPGLALGPWPVYDAGDRASLRVTGDGCKVEHDVDPVFRRQVWQ